MHGVVCADFLLHGFSCTDFFTRIFCTDFFTRIYCTDLTLQSLFFFFLTFFRFAIFLALLCVFPFFSKDLKGSAEILAFWGVILAFWPNKQGLEGPGDVCTEFCRSFFARIFWGVPNHLLGSALISPRKTLKKFSMLWGPSGGAWEAGG